MAEPLAPIDAGADALPPSRIVEIPAHGLGEAGLERLLRRPAEFAPQLRCVDRIAPVMAGPVGDKSDKGGSRLALNARRHLVEQSADRLDDVDIGALGAAADIVALADAALLGDRDQRPRVILDIEPVADIAAVAIDGHRLALQGVEDRQRNQFLGKMIRAVVVRAIRADDGQSISVAPGAHEMIGGGLRGGVGGVRPVRAELMKEIVRAERAKDLVGRHVMEPKSVSLDDRQLAPIVASPLQKSEGPDHVGVDKRGRSVDRAIDVAFRRQMHHHMRPEIVDDGAYCRRIANIDPLETIASILRDRREIVEISRISQLVDHAYAMVGLSNEAANHRRADKSSPARDEEPLAHEILKRMAKRTT